MMRKYALALALVLCSGAVGADELSSAGQPAASATVKLAKPGPNKPQANKPKKAKGPPAKELFGSVTAPAPLAARAIGSYARGCLAGGVSLPINGPDWQVMRLSRDRNWGHPLLLDFLEKFASDARGKDGWPGLLIGDMAQPRGGPMITGHASHQIGLDADVWLTPMPDRILTPEERETMTATSMLKDPFTVDMKLWTPLHTKLIKRAASYPEVSRIFVHPAIKKVLCEEAGKDRSWLYKVRPWWGHYYHFHIRLACPPGSVGCENQPPVQPDDGCGAELDKWFAVLRRAEIDASRHPQSGAAPNRPGPALDDLPAECRTVLASGGNEALLKPGAIPPSLKTAAGNDAGPPAPHLDKASLDALIASSAKKKPH